MKFRVDRDVLAEAVAWTARSIPNRPNVYPQLSGLLMTTDDQGLSLNGFDYETSGHVTVPADVADEGRVLVSGRLLADISRALPDHPVDVVLEGQKLAVTCGSARFSLQTMALDDYPELPSMPDIVGTVDGDAFSHAVAQAVTAAGKDEMLPVLTGVKLEIEGDRLSLLATDRFRLSLRELDWSPAATDASFTALVPARVLGDTAKSLSSGSTLEIGLATGEGEGMIGFASSGANGERRTTTRLIDGGFPNVRQLFPSTSEVQVRMETADLVGAVRRVSLVAGRNTPIRLTFADEQVTLEAGNGEEAQASEAVPAQITGGDISIGFNPSYLLEGLGAIGSSHVHIAMTQPARPAAFASLAELDGEPDLAFRYLLMPLRMQS